MKRYNNNYKSFMIILTIVLGVLSSNVKASSICMNYDDDNTICKYDDNTCGLNNPMTEEKSCELFEVVFSEAIEGFNPRPCIVFHVDTLTCIRGLYEF